MSGEQLSTLPDLLLSRGAEAYGFRGELWTCRRVIEVIRAEFGVSYHRAHVSRLLKALRWTPQVPVERASRRDEAAIAEVARRGLAGAEKKAREEDAVIVCIDEAGFYLLPGLVRTYTSQGRRPCSRCC